MNLLNDTLSLIKGLNTKDSEDLCAKIGVSVRWLYKLRSGEISEPSCKKIQKIYDIMSK